MFSSKRVYPIVFALLAVILVLLTLRFRWQGNSGRDWNYIIDGDSKGYYAYLEQIFVTHNFGQAKVDYEQINAVNGHSLIKYYCGTALLTSPFFLVSAAIASISHQPMDAYSGIFQKTISLAGIVYLLLGLLFASRLLRQFKISDLNIILTLILFVFGSNLLTYTVLHPMMSHVYSFFAISLLLWLFNSFVMSGKKKFLLWTAVILGLVYLIRPLNLVIVFFLLFLVNDFKGFIVLLKKNSKTVLLALGLFLATVSLQNILWWVQCGKFFTWSYSHEGFYFAHPEFFRVLFGFRKGLFVYTPLLGISLLGLLVLLRKNKIRFFFASGFLLLITYLISAWWCWSYSDGLGMRPFIDFYVIFILLFALLLQSLNVWIKWAVVVLSLAPLSLNLLQNYQYQKGILHAEYMNRERYQTVFLKTSDAYMNCFGGSDDLPPYNFYQQQAILETPFMPGAFTPDSAHVETQRGDTEKAFVYDDRYEFNFVYKVNNSEELFRAQKTYALIHLKKLDLHPCQFRKTLFVVALSYPDRKNAFFKSFPLEPYAYLKQKRWHELSYTIILPKILQKDFELKFYIWNRSLDIFLVKDVEIKIFRTN
ncbi:MAG: hypothetical protein WCL06_08725 [Bacteroidota bacterium]